MSEEERRAANARYISLVRTAALANIEQWLTPVCPECNLGLWMAEFDQDYHEMIGPNVIIGCEGYWVINPHVVGLPREQWSDWLSIEDEVDE